MFQISNCNTLRGTKITHWFKKKKNFSEIPNESDTIITSYVFKFGRFNVKFGILFDLSRLFCCTVNLVTSFGYDICINFNLLQM